MKIRAHHLLCIQGFQGYGYSEEFTENMSKVIQNLKSFPNHKIQITTCCDIFCACCPHNIGDKCAESSKSNEKIIEMDVKVLKTIGLPVNTIIEAHDAFQLINNYFKSSNISEICGNCKWKDKCLFFSMKI